MQALRRFFASTLIALLLIGAAAPVFDAQAVRIPTDVGSYVECLKEDSDPSLCTYIGSHGMTSLATGSFSMIPPLDENGNPLTGYRHGLVDDLTGAMAYMYDYRPANTVTYVADLMDTMGGFGAQTAYAQDSRGIGFVGLQPILQVWKAFRNITYFLFVIFFVIVGFMIMFRRQINPQTVISLQNALPSMVVTLILITFSYAIAGLVVDMIYFSIYLIAGILELGGLLASGNAFTAAESLLSRSIFGVGFRYFLGIGEAAGRVAFSVNLIVREVFSTVPVVGDVGGQYLAGALASVVTYFIAAIAVIIALFRTFFALLKAYVALILHVVFAPFEILMNVFPGSGAFGNWLKAIVANAAVFPVTAAFIMLGIILMGYSPAAGADGEREIRVAPGIGFSRNAFSGEDPGGFVPPLVLPGNTGTVDVLQALIGFGIIMLLPEVTQIVRGFFGIEDKLGELAMQNAMRGSGPVTAPFRWGAGLARQFYGLAAMNMIYSGAIAGGWRGALRGGFSALNPFTTIRTGTRNMRIQRELEERMHEHYSGMGRSSTSPSDRTSADSERATEGPRSSGGTSVER